MVSRAAAMAGVDQLDRTAKSVLYSRANARHAQVAQLVEHATENRSVGGSIPPLGTICYSAKTLARLNLELQLTSRYWWTDTSTTSLWKPPGSHQILWPHRFDWIALRRQRS